MSLQPAVELAEGQQFFHGEEAAVGQRGVQRCARVPLRKEQPVAFRPIRPGGIDLQVMKIERRQDLRDRKRAADVPALRVVDHAQRVEAKLLRLG